jgi:hypothetical protein
MVAVPPSGRQSKNEMRLPCRPALRRWSHPRRISNPAALADGRYSLIETLI